MIDGWYKLTSSKAVKVRFVYNNFAEDKSVLDYQRNGFLFEPVEVFTKEQMDRILEGQPNVKSKIS